MGTQQHRKTIRALMDGFAITLDNTHVIQLVPPGVTIFEAEDANFHFGSAVFMPMGMELARHEELLTVSSLETVLEALEYGESASEVLCLAGHTDTVGSETSNTALSERRAANLAAFIQGDRTTWAQTCADHVDEDIQHLLTWAAYAHGYGCDPGPIDGQIGPRTKAALAQFRRAHNLVHGTALTEGEQPFADMDWDAVFTLYDASAIRLLGGDEGRWQALKTAVRWYEPKLLACGEAWPLEGQGRDNYRSQTNRRVELIYLDASDFPGLAQESPPAESIYGEHGIRRYVPIAARKLPFELKILDCSRAALKQRAFRIEVAGEKVEGQTDDDGKIRAELPATALSGLLAVDAGSEEHPLELRWSLMLGPMPPLALGAGAQGRLGHLGVAAGTLRDGATEPPSEVVSAYQRTRIDLTDSGAIDDDTRRTLDDEYAQLA